MQKARVLRGICAMVTLGLAVGAQASLIGDTVNFQCTNCGPPTSDDFVVVEGAPELTLFDSIEIDVEDASLRINWLINSSSISSNINFVWSDLDWVNMAGEITAVTIDPSSTWGISPQEVSINFGINSVSVTNNGDETVSPGDFLLLNLNVTHVPIPAAAWLFGSGLLGLVSLARAKKTA